MATAASPAMSTDLLAQLRLEREDAELRVLRERLELVERQRTLAAAKCQRFATEMEQALQHQQPAAAPPDATARRRHSPPRADLIIQEDEWASFSLSAAKPKHGAYHKARRASLDQGGSSGAYSASARGSGGHIRTSLDVARPHLNLSPSNSSSGETPSPNGTHASKGQREYVSSAPDAGCGTGVCHKASNSSLSRSRRASFEADKAAAEYYCSVGRPASRKSSLARDATDEQALAPCEVEDGLFQYKSRLSQAWSQAAPTLSKQPTTMVTSSETLQSGACCPVGTDTEAADTSEASDAEDFLRARAPRRTMKPSGPDFGGAMHPVEPTATCSQHNAFADVLSPVGGERSFATEELVTPVAVSSEVQPKLSKAGFFSKSSMRTLFRR